MGKTIRRKNVDRLGLFDYKNEEKQGKADAFFHGDTGRNVHGNKSETKSFVKVKGNLQSRKEKRMIKSNPALDLSNRDLARKTAVPFYLY